MQKMFNQHQLDLYGYTGVGQWSEQKSGRKQVCFVAFIGLPEAEPTTRNCSVEGRRLRKKLHATTNGGYAITLLVVRANWV